MKTIRFHPPPSPTYRRCFFSRSHASNKTPPTKLIRRQCAFSFSFSHFALHILTKPFPALETKNRSNGFRSSASALSTNTSFPFRIPFQQTARVCIDGRRRWCDGLFQIVAHNRHSSPAWQIFFFVSVEMKIFISTRSSGRRPCTPRAGTQYVKGLNSLWLHVDNLYYYVWVPRNDFSQPSEIYFPLPVAVVRVTVRYLLLLWRAGHPTLIRSGLNASYMYLVFFF